MLDIFLQVFLGLLYANLGEWLFHKLILHGLGKKPHSIWAFHWHEHHAVCAKNAMLDPGYHSIKLTAWNAQTKELAVFAGTVLVHFPLVWFYPVFSLTLYASLVLYYLKHRKAHMNPVWAKEHLRWHYEHHINPESGNWCVTWPWFDYLLGTRSLIKDR